MHDVKILVHRQKKGCMDSFYKLHLHSGGSPVSGAHEQIHSLRCLSFQGDGDHLHTTEVDQMTEKLPSWKFMHSRFRKKPKI